MNESKDLRLHGGSYKRANRAFQTFHVMTGANDGENRDGLIFQKTHGVATSGAEKESLDMNKTRHGFNLFDPFCVFAMLSKGVGTISAYMD